MIDSSGDESNAEEGAALLQAARTLDGADDDATERRRSTSSVTGFGGWFSGWNCDLTRKTSASMTKITAKGMNLEV